MDLGLAGKVALVTGGSRGLGRAICAGLAAEGAGVVVNYRRGQEEAEEIARSLKQTHGVSTLALQADVSRSHDVAALFDRCYAEFGRLDIVINNAGIWPSGFVHEIDEEAWDRTLAVNLKGPFLCCREALRRWRDEGRGGRVVNVSSPAAFLGSTTGHADYAASKAGLCNFTISLAREVAPWGIYVNAVAPGMMYTEMAAEALQKNEAHYMQRIPLKRFGDPQEIAHMVTFLASDRASYTTGATVDVSGGMLMR